MLLSWMLDVNSDTIFFEIGVDIRAVADAFVLEVDAGTICFEIDVDMCTVSDAIVGDAGGRYWRAAQTRGLVASQPRAGESASDRAMCLLVQAKVPHWFTRHPKGLL